MDFSVSQYFRVWRGCARASQIDQTALRLSEMNPRKLILMINDMQSMGNHGLTEARAYLRAPGVLPTLILSGYQKHVCRMIDREEVSVQQELLTNPQIREGLKLTGHGAFIRHVERQWYDHPNKYSSNSQQTYSCSPMKRAVRIGRLRTVSV